MTILRRPSQPTFLISRKSTSTRTLFLAQALRLYYRAIKESVEDTKREEEELRKKRKQQEEIKVPEGPMISCVPRPFISAGC